MILHLRPAESGNLKNSKQGSVARSLSLPPTHHADVTEILWEKHKSLSVYPYETMK